MTRLHNISIALILLSLVCVRPQAANAALGGSAGSVASDARVLGAVTVSHSSAAASNAPSLNVYAVERLAMPSGIKVNEYIGLDGRVFAVSWRGMRPPDLTVLMGAYFRQYRDAAEAGGLTALGLHHASVRASDVEVETAGHMRDMWGRAWLPAALPASVSAQEIR